MAKKNRKKQAKYDLDYFDDPPPTHNPLIGPLHIDTLVNVRDALHALQELKDRPEEVALPRNVTDGLHFLMGCAINALEFEIKHRE